MNHGEGATRSFCGSFQAYPQWSYYLDIWCMVWWLDCFHFNLELFKWNVFMLPFASANDDAADYFFAIDDDEPFPHIL